MLLFLKVAYRVGWLKLIHMLAFYFILLASDEYNYFPRRFFSDYSYLSEEYAYVGFPGGSVIKNLPAVQETQVHSCIGKIPWRRECLPTPVFLPEEFHEQRSLGSYSPWDLRVSHGWVTNTKQGRNKSILIISCWFGLSFLFEILTLTLKRIYTYFNFQQSFIYHNSYILLAMQAMLIYL